MKREGKRRREAYSNPTVKIPISPTFCLIGSFNFDSTGIGSTKIPISVTIFNTLVVYQNGRFPTHLPLMLLSQNASTGMQGMKDVEMVSVP
jgi:hypothetical protein